MARSRLRPAYGFQPFGFAGLPAGPYGFGNANMLPPGVAIDYNDVAVAETVDVEPAKPRRRGVSRKPGRVARCKVVKIRQRNGKVAKRRLCWDKRGVLASNTKAGSRKGGSARKVVCKRKCPKGSRAVCKGGYRKVKGKRVCRKFVCRRAA